MLSYKELKVWQESILLVKEIYSLTKGFPKEELFVLTSQIRRAAISIPSNIAEGQRRRGTHEFLHFCQIAFGSAGELDTQLVIANELDFIDQSKYQQVTEHLDHVLRMLNKLTASLVDKSK